MPRDARSRNRADAGYGPPGMPRQPAEAPHGAAVAQQTAIPGGLLEAQPEGDVFMLVTMVKRLAESWEREVVHLRDDIESRLAIRDYLQAALVAEKAHDKEIAAIRLRELLAQFNAKVV